MRTEKNYKIFMDTSSFIWYHILKIRVIDPYGTRGSVMVLNAILDILHKTSSPFKLSKKLQYDKYLQTNSKHSASLRF